MTSIVSCPPPFGLVAATAVRPRVQAERSLQAECMLRLAAYPIVAIPIPNGIWLPSHEPREVPVVKRFIARVKRDGMLLSGAPDLALFWAGGAGLIELKRPAHRDLFGRHPAGTPSMDQREFARRCEALGVHHAYCRSWDAVLAQLVAWGALQ